MAFHFPCVPSQIQQQPDQISQSLIYFYPSEGNIHRTFLRKESDGAAAVW
jgi:hypothetical protein